MTLVSDDDIEVKILLVEDDERDVDLTKRSFEKNKIKNALTVVGDGAKALAYLRKQPPYEGAELPDLILLDLNLPGIDGRDVLREIKEDRELRKIPVIVLTSSPSEEDIVRSYELHANSYLRKPVSFDGLAEMLRAFKDYWFKIVRLPPHQG